MTEHDDIVQEGEVDLEAMFPTEDDNRDAELVLAESELAGIVQSKWSMARDGRRVTEFIWLRAFRDIRGQYDSRQKALISQLQVTNPQASSVFIKIAKTKAQTAYGQLLEVLLAEGRVPIGVEPTPVPDGAADIAHIVDEGSPEADNTDVSPESVIGFSGDGRDIPPGATEQSLLGGLKESLGKFLGNKKVVEGPATDPNQVELTPAKASAIQVEKLIRDQLSESSSVIGIRQSAWECVHLGTGCIKGPMTTNKIIHKWTPNEDTGEMEYTPEVSLFPETTAPTVWNIYPDPRATCIADAEYVVERHLLTKAELRGWKKRPGFNKNVINQMLQIDPSYTPEHWEADLFDNNITQAYNHRYDVKEYWGYVDESLAERLGIDFDQDSDLQLVAFVWNDQILKVSINPFIPQRVPYLLAPYEEVAYQIWGVGIPENMSDSQTLMNAHWRAAIDNLNLAGNVMLEVNKNKMLPGQDFKIRPGKIWKTQGAPGQSIFGIRFQDTSPSHFSAFDRARSLADESTGILSFGQGAVNLPSAVRTSSQTSMLLQGSAQAIKTVTKNYDQFILEPLGQGYFQWNMQFNTDLPEIRGDFEIVAKGTSSLIQREVQSQRLLTFAQVAGSNPVMAPLVDFEFIMKELAKTLDLDPDKVINDPTKAKLIAGLMQIANGGAPQGQSQQSPEQAASPVPDAGAGGGTIGGASQVAQPGEQQFSGAAQ